MLQEFSPSPTRLGPLVQVYQILPLIKRGDILFADDFSGGGQENKWTVYDGEWIAQQKMLKGEGIVPGDYMTPLPSEDTNGAPKGWSATLGVDVAMQTRIVQMNASTPNAQLLSPAVHVEGRSDYTVRFELKAQVVVPAFHVQWYAYSNKGDLLAYRTLATFQESTDWVKGSCTLPTSVLPAGTDSVRLVFKWWSESGKEKGTAWIRNLYFGRQVAYNLAVARVNDEITNTWDDCTYEATILWTGESQTKQGGIAFRYQDVQNYYFVELDENVGLVRVGKVVKGDRQVLTEQHADVGELRPHRLTITARGNSIDVLLDGSEVVSVADGTFGSGKVALWVGAGASVYFQNVQVVYDP